MKKQKNVIDMFYTIKIEGLNKKIFSGSRIWTCDIEIMSLASYQTALSRKFLFFFLFFNGTTNNASFCTF